MISEPQDPLPITEQDNLNTANLSSLPLNKILRLMNDEDSLVAAAVGLVIPQIEEAVAGTVSRIREGGRLFYIGTGTSGRLGVLDAAECPPTFGVSPDLVQGIIAGGYDACHRSVEASEDDAQAAIEDLSARGFGKIDVLVGIAASGSTPYTVGAIEFARETGAYTVALTSVPQSQITKMAEVSIVPVVGPEVVTGSTRLKAGTAQKMVLNMLSTATMVQLGYVTGNRMTNMLPRNDKLRARSVRIFSAETGATEEASKAALESAGGDLRTALVMNKTGRSREDSEVALGRTGGVVEQAVKFLQVS